MEKLAFSLITVARKLRPYFQAHVINVLIDHPLKKAMYKLEAIGRLIQWAVELSEFNVRHRPREVIKAQVLADFIAKFTTANNQIPRCSFNGCQFDNTLFRGFCEQLGIRNHYFSPFHPQANGQAKVANQFLLKIIKTQLERTKGIWPEELPSVLWAYRTTVRTPIGETPFKLAYGSDAVITAKVGLTSYRVAYYNNEENEKQFHLSLDLIDEVRMDAEQRVAHYKNLMTKHHDALVKPW
ncbi:uncharacterized protein LOC142628700 [Castanea sativa]|uniref:uncharacterized protein LOC142628700 n=1 Tax=Castanea sativa TaxID=21020 RepID=UPI003F64FC6C